MISAPINDTIKVTWINSGVTPTDIYCAVFTGSETLIDSATMTSSGNGHYYHNHTTVGSAGFFMAETRATINSKPYTRRQRFRVITGEAD